MWQVEQKVSKYCRNMTGIQVSTSNKECCLSQHTNVYLEEHTGLYYFYSEANVPVMKEVEYFLGLFGQHQSYE